EGSSRFSNAGSARTLVSPRIKWPRNGATLSERDVPTSTLMARGSKEMDVQASPDHTWPRWSGLDPGAQEPARMGSLVTPCQRDTSVLRTHHSIASSGQFDSVTS
ncbi:hypothetical protein CLAIMM_07272, partial [Cladophialophora immunda]